MNAGDLYFALHGDAALLDADISTAADQGAQTFSKRFGPKVVQQFRQTGDAAALAFGTGTQRAIDATTDRLSHQSTVAKGTVRVIDDLTNRFAVFGPEGPIVRDMATFGIHFAKLAGHLGDDSAVIAAITRAGATAGTIYSGAVMASANLGAGLSLIWGEAAAAGSVVGAIKAGGLAAGQLYGASLLAGLSAVTVVGGGAAIGNQIADFFQNAVGPDTAAGQAIQSAQNQLFFGQVFGQEGTMAQSDRIAAAARQAASVYMVAFADTTGRSFPLVVQSWDDAFADILRTKDAGTFARLVGLESHGASIWDNYGHQAGDQFGSTFATTVKPIIQRSLIEALSANNPGLRAEMARSAAAWAQQIGYATQQAGVPRSPTTPNGR